MVAAELACRQLWLVPFTRCLPASLYPCYCPTCPAQLFDECEVVAVVAGPAVLGVEALLQHAEPACAARPYGYR